MANLYDKASLVLPVSPAYKDGVIQAYKPLTSQGTFDFSRGSNLAATRVNSDGLIEKGRENLLLQSNQFDTTWTISNTSVTGGQSGYDGSSDAWLLQATASTSTARLQQPISLTGVYTTSIYAKAGSTDWIAIQMWSNHFAYFDVANGVVVNSGSVIDASIEATGNGFYRCSISYNASSVANLWVYVIDGNGSTSVTSGKNVYLQSAQLEVGLVATDYIETTTTTAVSGITEDLPRLDYSGSASCPSLLLEPQRSNLSAYSEYFNGSIWIQSACSVTDNDATSPEGVTNAAKIAGDGTDNQIRLYDNYTFPSAGNYTISVFAKAGNNDFIALAYKGVNGGITAYFDLSEGTTSDTTNGTIEAVGSDGWYRCSLTANLTGPDLTGNYNMYVARNLTTTTFPSNGDANGQYVHIYGYQVESNSYPTSYIPTYGSSVTRSADSCSKTGISSLIGDSEGTLYFEANVFDNTGSYFVSLSDGTVSNRVSLGANTSVGWNLILTVGGVNQAVIQENTPVVENQIYKVAIKYNINDFKMYVNGSQVGADISGSTYAGGTLSRLALDVASGSLPFYGNVKQLIVFPTALSNTELAALTTIA